MSMNDPSKSGGAGLETFYYDNTTVRNFLIATTIFGIIGMTVGLLVAIQFVWPEANFGLQYTTVGRVRPLHTNAVIFAFVGNGIFAGVYYSLQRLVKARMWRDTLSKSEQPNHSTKARESFNLAINS